MGGLCILKLEVHGFRAISIRFNESSMEPPAGGAVRPEILVLFVLPKEDVIGLHDREKHRQEEVEIGPQSSTLIPLPYRGRRRLKSQAASSRTSSQNVDGRVKWEPLIQLSIVKRVWCLLPRASSGPSAMELKPYCEGVSGCLSI